jgi:PqqD family protein of HPr-rel-A system
VPAAAKGVEVRAMGNDALVHDAANGKVHVLNASAARIFALCDGARSSEDIASLMSAETGEPRERILRDVGRALETFLELKLIRY